MGVVSCERINIHENIAVHDTARNASSNILKKDAQLMNHART